jgi:hypothetical protein
MIQIKDSGLIAVIDTRHGVETDRHLRHLIGTWNSP